MPFRWTFSQTEELVHVVGDGSLDVSGAVEVLYAVTGSVEFCPDWRILVDFSEMVYEPNPADAVEIARALGVARPLLRGPLAVVLADAESFALAKIAAAMASQSGLTIRAFRDLEAARAWLSAV